jgi:hypothetical protein
MIDIYLNVKYNKSAYSGVVVNSALNQKSKLAGIKGFQTSLYAISRRRKPSGLFRFIGRQLSFYENFRVEGKTE